MNLNKYSKFLNELIQKDNLILSTELSDALRNEFDTLSSTYPRKLISRAVLDGVLHSSKPLTFGNGQFLYLNPIITLDKDLIKQVSKIRRPPVYRLLDLMDHNDGIISYYEALKVTASTDEKTSTKITLTKDIVKDLVAKKILREVSDNRNIKYLIYKDEDDLHDAQIPEQLINNHYQKMLIDTIFIPDTLRWLQACNIIDNIRVIYRSTKVLSLGASHNGVIWDAFGYTKTTGLTDFIAVNAVEVSKQTLVVLDIIINREYLQTDFDAFISRIQIHINSVKTIKRRVVPIVVYANINEKTLNTLKRNGFMTFEISNIFGGNISKVIDKVGAMNMQSIDYEFKDIKKALKLIEKNGLDDKLKSLRGALFESILYPFLKLKYGNAKITQGKIIIDKLDKSRYREFDYFIESSQPHEIILIELKGYPKTSSIALGNSEKKGTLRYFFKGSVPFAQKNLQIDTREVLKIKAIFITSGGFYEDGYKFLETMNKSKLKSAILDCHFDGDRLIEQLKLNNFDYEAKTIKKYFTDKS